MCAGKDDLSSEDEEIASEPTDEVKIKHKFSQPDNFKMVLESGKIPDAAMIHAARKSRQKAREQGKFVFSIKLNFTKYPEWKLLKSFKEPSSLIKRT